MLKDLFIELVKWICDMFKKIWRFFGWSSKKEDKEDKNGSDIQKSKKTKK